MTSTSTISANANNQNTIGMGGLLRGAVSVLSSNLTSFIVAMTAVTLATLAGAWMFQAVGAVGHISGQHLALGMTLLIPGAAQILLMDHLGTEMTGFDMTSHSLTTCVAIVVTGGAMASHGHYDLGAAANAALLLVGLTSLPTVFNTPEQGYPRIRAWQSVAALSVFAGSLWLAPGEAKIIALPIAWGFFVAMAAAGKRLSQDKRDGSEVGL